MQSFDVHEPPSPPELLELLELLEPEPNRPPSNRDPSGLPLLLPLD
jgi:hypothetical protein